ncbi:adenylate/guanylate cyclase domain-containing protein [Pseudacidovorax sp. RU35E]|uniref:adenylate/guanylate cyclase domain-containing protein n=1 Tax=Pseudacidovorax sp. RU35E TaxID=1907403 RepID=UPI00095539B0|nr:adenylate/guanylate cyclase domain-containing protein [Pseudacidovorax sp. RU35E]SIR16126.1 adenylate cyclase [Pseudacidovorax sp. RU35E]
MSPPPPVAAPAFPVSLSLRSRRDLRWASGLVLMAYVTLHLLNHALGLVSLQVAEAVLRPLRSFWHSWPGTLLLYGAVVVHLVLAFVALWERRSLRMPPSQGLRIVLGFALPLLLASHLASMRGGYTLFGLNGSYARVVEGLWGAAGGVFQIIALAAAWTHGCMGLHFALRANVRWRRAQPLLLTVAVLLPTLAALGFVAMGREWQVAPGPVDAPGAAQGRRLGGLSEHGQDLYMTLLAALLLARLARGRMYRFPGVRMLTLRYPDRSVQVPVGWSVLEASRAHGIAHLSLCGGRARCSTCRIRVAGPAAHCPPPGLDEQRTLARVRAGAQVRLACQLRPTGDLEVSPLLGGGTVAEGQRPRLEGEREVAVLFVDLRRWSGLAERQWPFDLVYVLDRYFALVGQAVRESGGVPNQFIGDSVMAIFGLEEGLDLACRRAFQAAALISARMRDWSDGFEREFGQPLDFGMGLHAGSAAVGEVGHLEVQSFTAVGEVVNTASRLQEQTKAVGAALVASRFAARQAGLLPLATQMRRIEVRGRREPLDVVAWSAEALAVAVQSPGPSPLL